MAGTCGINAEKVIIKFFYKGLAFLPRVVGMGAHRWQRPKGEKAFFLSTNFLSDCACVPPDPTLRKGLARFVGFADDGRVLIWFEKKELER